jgi:hypothetical protein
MHFQVDFPQPLPLSALELHCSSDQYQLALELEGRDASGRWSPLPAEMQRSDRDPPLDEMKRLATSELKWQGVDYILVDLRGEGMNLIGPEIHKNPVAWGVRQAAAYGPIRLYHID